MLSVIMIISLIASYSLIIYAQELGSSDDISLLTVSELDALGISYAIPNYNSTEIENQDYIDLQTSVNTNTLSTHPSDILESYTFYTSDGSPVTAYELRDWATFDEAYNAHFDDIVGGGYTGLTVIDYPTYAYNDIAHAWYGTTDYWIYDDSSFLYDAHTVEIDENDVMVGDIVTYWLVGKNSYGELVYFSCLHSGIVDEIRSDGSIVCESKWDEYGLYIHDIENVHEDYMGSVVLNGVTVNACFFRYYRYVQDEHNLYMYEDNGEDGCIVKCDADENDKECSYTIECPEAPEYTSTSTGHYASCPSACFAFFEEHTDGEKINFDSYYHKVTCTICSGTYTQPHTWVTYGTKYRCLDCGRISDQAPSILQQVPPVDETTEVEIPIVEGEETVSTLPPVNDKEEYTE